MIHKDKSQFKDVVSMTANRTGFRASLIEKDYYLTLILSKLSELSQDLIFKGGTCLNKIAEDGGNLDLTKYHNNLGRSNNEISDMRSRVEKELFDVLTADERENFSLDKALERINKVMGKIK